MAPAKYHKIVWAGTCLCLCSIISSFNKSSKGLFFLYDRALPAFVDGTVKCVQTY